MEVEHAKFNREKKTINISDVDDFVTCFPLLYSIGQYIHGSYYKCLAGEIHVHCLYWLGKGGGGEGGCIHL